MFIVNYQKVNLCCRCRVRLNASEMTKNLIQTTIHMNMLLFLAILIALKHNANALLMTFSRVVDMFVVVVVVSFVKIRK